MSLMSGGPDLPKCDIVIVNGVRLLKPGVRIRVGQRTTKGKRFVERMRMWRGAHCTTHI